MVISKPYTDPRKPCDWLVTVFNKACGVSSTARFKSKQEAQAFRREWVRESKEGGGK